MRVLRRGAAPALLGLLVAGCAAEPWAFSLDDCGRTCGDGPYYLVDHFEIAMEDETGLDGFDLDGLPNDCEVEDGTSPDGAPGIDNQFGAIFDVLPDSVSAVIPLAIETSLQSGAMSIVVEVVRPDAGGDDGPVALVFREADGDVLAGTDGRPLGGQTLGLVDGDNVLGHSTSAESTGDVIAASELEVLLKLQYLDTSVELPVKRGMARLTDDGEGGLDLTIGGAVPVDAVMELVSGLGGDDENLRELLEAMIPLMVDARTDPDGPCDGLSGTFWGHAVPVYLFEP